MQNSVPTSTAKESRLSLQRLLARLHKTFPDEVESADWQAFESRLEDHFPVLFDLLWRIYGPSYDFFFHVEAILQTAAQSWLDRPGDLKSLDAIREGHPHWYQSNRVVGAMAYVDLFAGDLAGLREKISYLKEIGVTYLHLMPLFKSPAGDDDGGYAISSYRDLDPSIGTMDELRELSAELRQQGMSLVLDFVFNHTSDEHEWAMRALAGEVEYQSYYRMFPDRHEPDEYERTLRPIFPDAHPGSFTYRTSLGKWIWTTFNNFQWDLNYENPAVFNAMAGEMLFLANAGVEMLRMDAVPFLWKEKGTSCENLENAHLLIQAFNAMARIAAPALVFKSEAIVAPDEIKRYVSERECHLSYDPPLMVQLWNSIATRDARMLNESLPKRFQLPYGCSWVNYIRCHDDIGWGFEDRDLWEMNINPGDHRWFLNRFFCGEEPSSFARGKLFQLNPVTGDARICGTTASLCGLEKALEENDDFQIGQAIQRILLLHSILFTIGGVPLIYLGDEIGQLNDHSYHDDIGKDGDDRWLHRPPFDWEKAERRRDPESVEGRIFNGILKLSQIRKNNHAFNECHTEFIDTGNPHVFGYFRSSEGQSILCLANFSEHPQDLPATRLRQLGMRKTFTDIIAGRTIVATQKLTLEPLQFAALM
ncbi:alpha-glucosidase C-terminal domain-containing protein [Luteolibacter pohnpeiensis]|uniref:Alpha-glucosidase C-terminal domain-containing protein n=1 Tax=Luteolibacter pohnpeiensis TaxID=454153 RepID=A0A934VV43_9BACT|nr:alpha-amylase family glycosyl hydrolase [Luteolibacter pohnpeiensis]MBK1881408.1 alpha-glucosidase C-terminal domain-containing protein [Luteolibacter pohnpeiensis]